MVRLLIVLTMCCVVAAGNLPAFHHVASVAQVESADTTLASVNQRFACSCHHHQSTDSEQGDDVPEHDHENCRVCQSLLAVFAADEPQHELVSVPLLLQSAYCQERHGVFSADVFLPDSRGPPSSRSAS